MVSASKLHPRDPDYIPGLDSTARGRAIADAESVRSIITRRDGETQEQFDELLLNFLSDLDDQGIEAIEDLIEEHFGLEPDYAFDQELLQRM